MGKKRCLCLRRRPLDLPGFGGSAHTQQAFVISLASVCLSVAAAGIGLYLSVEERSIAIVGFSLENAVDALSSALCLWRFWGGGSASDEELEMREKRASIGIAALFIILAFVVGGMAGEHLSNPHEEDGAPGEALLFLSVPGFAVFLVLGLIKLRLGYKTKSASMKKDALCSLIGALLSFCVAIGYAIVQLSHFWWWFDAACALVASAGLFLFGCHDLWNNARKGHAWWTTTFWITPGRSSRRLRSSPGIRVSLGSRGVRMPPEQPHVGDILESSAVEMIEA